MRAWSATFLLLLGIVAAACIVVVGYVVFAEESLLVALLGNAHAAASEPAELVGAAPPVGSSSPGPVITAAPSTLPPRTAQFNFMPHALRPKTRAQVRARVIELMLNCTRLPDSLRAIPIWFGFPAVKLHRDRRGRKRELWALQVPAVNRKFNVNYYDERAYYDMYANATFAHTWAKNGYDCMRHDEIIACGGIPVFTGIAQRPMCTMLGHPNDLYAEIEYTMYSAARRLPDFHVEPVFYRLNSGNLITPIKPALPSDFAPPLQAWRDELDLYLESTLLNGALASTMYDYWLAHVVPASVLPRPPAAPSRVLFIDDYATKYPVYQSLSMLIGLYEAWPNATVDVMYPPRYVYTDYTPRLRHLYGRGFTYAKTVPAHKLRTVNASVAHANAYDVYVWGTADQRGKHDDCVPTQFAYVPHYKKWLLWGSDEPLSRKAADALHAHGVLWAREQETPGEVLVYRSREGAGDPWSSAAAAG